MGRDNVLIDRANQNNSGSTKYDLLKDEIFMKYANKSLPLQKKKTRAGLSPYTGPFTKKHATHLLKRTMFGAKATDVNSIMNMTASQAVDLVLGNANLVTPAPPVNYYENFYNSTQNIPYGGTWINQPYPSQQENNYRRLSLQAWWMNNILTQKVSIQEKMILFMTNFFPVELSNGGVASQTYNYLDLMRTHCLGNLKSFVMALTTDPAMLYYLNGRQNTASAPDENYGRELQELFTIGKLGNVFTEQDVIEASKVLTGWQVDYTTNTSYFTPSRHHTGTKSFSSFYNNTSIPYAPGATGGMTELTALINMIFTKQQEVAKHFCRNIYRFFVYYDIDANIESTIINGMATTMISNNWEIKPVLEILLKSDHFFDSNMMDCFIKTPMDYYLGMMRTADFQMPSSYSIEDAHRLLINISNTHLRLIGMKPGDPPNVSGFQAYYQTPFFHQAWINSDTLPRRVKTMSDFVGSLGIYVKSGMYHKMDWLNFVNTQISNPSNPDVIVQETVDYFLGIGLSQASRDYYKSHLLSNQTSNFYWTVAWNDYVNFPNNAVYKGVIETRLRNMIVDMFRLAENHLS